MFCQSVCDQGVTGPCAERLKDVMGTTRVAALAVTVRAIKLCSKGEKMNEIPVSESGLTNQGLQCIIPQKELLDLNQIVLLRLRLLEHR